MKKEGHLHDKSVINTPININLLPCSHLLVLDPLNLHTPEHERQLDGKHTLSHMPTGTDTSAKAKRHVALFLGSKRTRFQLTSGLINESSRVEEMSIGTVVRWVAVNVPHVCDQRRALGNDIAFVVDVFC